MERRKDVSRLNKKRKRTFEFEKKDLDRMERKYRLSDVGNVQVIDMLKEKISAGATKIRRYEDRELHCHQNTLFATNQKKLYQEFDGRSNFPNKVPDAQKAPEFWSNIWWIPENFNKNASWLPKVKENLRQIDKQEDIRVSVENVKTAIRKMTKWKAPVPDCVQRYWFKRFSSLHSRLTQHLQTCVVRGDVPTWVTKEKTTLIQKDPEKRNAANSYRPIACLPRMLRPLTSV